MKAKAIMVQATMSNSGKSFLTAGLLRIFQQAGYKAAPFKSQNMALNSYITKDGLEIGRAQAMQAEAAKIEPTVYMNPILLKPTSQMKSQVIVNGEVIGNMSAADYYQYKKSLIPKVWEAYNKLSQEYEIIVIEGAGSPAEINLKENDIVNMGMAKMANAPVLLIGDIDRGGVFASLYGTIKLLEKEEQAFIKGIIINKFRGDKKILEPGLKMIEEKVQVPVIGVIPMEKIYLDEEDSLAQQLYDTKERKEIDIAVIRFPHISNFTDFRILENKKDISLRYVENIDKMGNPDFILLPGTKNTIADLQWLKESKISNFLIEQAKIGTFIMGICGGFQMLGEKIIDPDCAESSSVLQTEGIGLLQIDTIFEKTKTRKQVTGKVVAKNKLLKEFLGETISGYEIHMGKTIYSGKENILIYLEDGRADGFYNEKGNVFGTYLHGFFDTPEVAQRIISQLRKKKGLYQKEMYFNLKEQKEQEYNKLAECIKNTVDLERVYNILKAGI